VGDPLLLFTCWWGTENWQLRNRLALLRAEIAFMFGFTKVVKLVGQLRRNPCDIMFLLVSILFGYFHGLIKLYALFRTQRGKPPAPSLNPPDIQAMML
jgi:hypothetical protein